MALVARLGDGYSGWEAITALISMLMPPPPPSRKCLDDKARQVRRRGRPRLTKCDRKFSREREGDRWASEFKFRIARRCACAHWQPVTFALNLKMRGWLLCDWSLPADLEICFLFSFKALRCALEILIFPELILFENLTLSVSKSCCDVTYSYDNLRYIVQKSLQNILDNFKKRWKVL